MEAIAARMAAVAQRQHAHITLDQLVDLKITRHQREHLLATGRIVRVGRQVYRLNGAPTTWQGGIAAAQLAAGPEAVVSHRSAATLYGLDGFDHQHVTHLSVPVSRALRTASKVRLHRCTDYELIRIERRQRIPVTDPARLVLDLYASERNPQVARRGLFSVRKKVGSSFTSPGRSCGTIRRAWCGGSGGARPSWLAGLALDTHAQAAFRWRVVGGAVRAGLAAFGAAEEAQDPLAQDVDLG